MDQVNQNNNLGTHTETSRLNPDGTTSRMLTGMFRDRDAAERAYNTLASRGYSNDDVDLIMTDETRKAHFGEDNVETELGTKAMEGAGKGSAIGGTVGAIVGAVAAIGTSLLIPGLGLVVAGPIVAALAGAGAGGLTGGIIGALIGHGIPEERARLYEQGLKDGHIVMGIKPRNDEDGNYIRNEWENTAKGEYVNY